jgi:hypothetical protein
MIFAALRTPVMMSSGPDRPHRASRDAEKLKAAVKRVRIAGEEKRARLSEELQNSVNNIDRIAREEIDFLKSLFEDEPTMSDASFDEIDDIIVFKDE